MDEDGGRIPAFGRRGFLLGAATTVTAGLAAGCGGAGKGYGGSGPPPAGNGAAGTVLGPVGDVPVHGGKVYAELEVVVTQPEPGVLQGFSAVCTHTGCIVNKVADGTIDCPCHGSRYGLDGSVRAGPAPRALAPRPVRVDGGQIVLT